MVKRLILVLIQAEPAFCTSLYPHDIGPDCQWGAIGQKRNKVDKMLYRFTRFSAALAVASVLIVGCLPNASRDSGAAAATSESSAITVAQNDGRSLKQKAKAAQRMIKERASSGEDVSGYLVRMKKANRHFKKGERQEGEALLDEVLAELESGVASPSAGEASAVASPSQWSTPKRVRIKGYESPGDNKMEVGISPDGAIIFFNNSNKKPAKTDVFYATRVGDDDTLFEFRGPIEKANKSGVLDATPAYDREGRLSFVSSRVKPPAVYWGYFANGEVRDVELVPMPLPKPFFALDMELGSDRNTVVFTYRSWREKNHMDVGYAEWNGQKYIMPDNWKDILAEVNTDAWEYAPDITTDMLELWFTRLIPGGGPVIYSATRKSTSEPFTIIARHPTITGLVEAPTLTGDNNTMYYHCRDLPTKTWEICVTHRL